MELTALNVSNELKEQIYKNMNEIHVSVDVFVDVLSYRLTSFLDQNML